MFFCDIEIVFAKQYVISGSGDSTLRIWDFLKGKEIYQVDCSQDANLEALEIENATETDLKVKRTPYPAVLRFNIAKIRKTGWNF